MSNYVSESALRAILKFPGSAVFQVFVDGTQVFDSGVVSIWSPARTVELDVRDKSVLRLVVTDGGDGYVCDHADWADAKLTLRAPGAAAGSVLSRVAADSSTAEVAWAMPHGGTSSNTTWPQTYVGQSEPGGRYTGPIPCGVTAQIDTWMRRPAWGDSFYRTPYSVVAEPRFPLRGRTCS